MNREELISAYLDDELPAEQRQEIERLLAVDAGARRLRDELRAQREALAALPRLGVGRDLTEEVLRAAERRMLLDSAALASPPSDTTDWLRRARRPAAWAAAVLAAGLLIALLSPREEPTVAARFHESVREGAAEDRAGAHAAADEAARKSGESSLVRDVAELGVPAELPKIDAQAFSQPALGKGGSRGPTPGQGEFGKAGAPVSAYTAPPPSQAATSGRAAPPATSLEQSVESAAQTLGFDQPAAPLASGTLLICDASPEAVADNAFTRVLVNNDVRVETPEADASSPRADAAVAGPVDLMSTGEAESNVRATTWVVQATEEQMLGILDELSQQPTRFNVAVAPPPAPGGASQQQPLPARAYLSQFPPRGGARARRLLQGAEARQEGGESSLSNAWIVNRLSQAPGGPVNVEVPEADASKKERAQGQAFAGGAGGQVESLGKSPPSPGEPLQSYMVILREAPASNAPRQQAAPAVPKP